MAFLFLLLLLLLNSSLGVIGADEYSRNDFPPDFIFGSGTTAYQVEGAAAEDGRTPSVWDTIAHTVYGPGENGDVACDQYHKYKEDVQLMVETGLDAYRFSISWPRLIPNGRGPVNPKGVQYYNNLINELVRHGIQPHVMLQNYDFPQALEDEYGGWVSRKMVKDFTAYADVCFREFGDRVLHWSTVNEPNVFSVGGYDIGFVPPQRCSAPFGFVNCSRGNSSTEPYIAAHHILLAHASVVRLYRRKYQDKQHGFIGLSIYGAAILPLSNAAEDIIAAQRARDFFLGWFLDPLNFGDYPKVMKKNVGSRMPSFTKAESRLVKGSFDFIGIIHYSIIYSQDDSISLTMENRDFMTDMGVKFSGFSVQLTPHWQFPRKMLDNDIEFEFPIAPWGLREVLEYMKQAYGNPPLYVYENGQGMEPSLLEDVPRVKYLHAYIGAVLDAIRNGSDTRGFFTWSFLDVFELLDGYESGFGHYYVDQDDPDLKRYPKLSAKWYSSLLKGGTVSLDGVAELEKNHLGNSHAQIF